MNNASQRCNWSLSQGFEVKKISDQAQFLTAFQDVDGFNQAELTLNPEGG